MSDTVLVVNDLHCGSEVAIMPKEVVGENQVYKATSAQLRLLREWENIRDVIGRPDYVIANGDLVEGVNYKESGRGNWTNNIHTQVKAAVKLLTMLDARHYAISEGSGYHIGANPAYDQMVADEMPDKYDVEYDIDMAMTIKKHKYRLHINHKVPVSTSPYFMSTPLAKELVASVMNQQDFGVFQGIIRAHLHHYFYVESGSRWGVIVPGWKGRDGYLKRKGLNYVPKVGWFAFVLENGEMTERCKVMYKLEKQDLIKEVVW
jgi:hypothetical protein